MNELELNIVNQRGILKQTISFEEIEGRIINFDILGEFLVTWTTNNFIKLFNINRNVFKQLGNARRFEDSSGNLGQIKQCSINFSGNRIAIISQRRNFQTFKTESFFCVYDVDIDTFTYYDFGKGEVPVQAFFDKSNSRFFGVLTRLTKVVKPAESTLQIQGDFRSQEQIISEELSENSIGTLQLFTFFFTSETGITKQDTYELDKSDEGILAIQVPYIHYIKQSSASTISGNYRVEKQLSNDFIGLDNMD